MKSLVYILLFISSLCSGQNNKHIGEWTGIDNFGNKSSIIFDENNFVFFKNKNHSYGGETFTVKNIDYTYKYEINYSKYPIRIDFILIEKEAKMEKLRVKSIIRFIDDNTIEIRNSDDKKYPKKFTGKTSSHTIILNKVLNND